MCNAKNFNSISLCFSVLIKGNRSSWVLLIACYACTCRSGGHVKKGESRLFYDVTEDHAHIAVVGLGPKPGEVPDNQIVMEDIDVARQHVRSAAAVGAKLLQSARVKEMMFDDFSDAEGKNQWTFSP